MTASRRPGLTFGDPRSTSETSDRDPPARAATVSSVGLRSARAASNDLLPPYGALHPNGTAPAPEGHREPWPYSTSMKTVPSTTLTGWVRTSSSTGAPSAFPLT